jgi:hypothetical protein
LCGWRVVWFCLLFIAGLVSHVLLFQDALHSATTTNLWHCKVMFFFQIYGLFVRKLWKFCPLLFLVIFWTQVVDIGVLLVDALEFIISTCWDIHEDLAF